MCLEEAKWDIPLKVMTLVVSDCLSCDGYKLGLVCVISKAKFLLEYRKESFLINAISLIHTITYLEQVFKVQRIRAN